MAKIITIANHKGGVGKTTSVASLGVAISMLGKRVLLIDLDAQQNLTFMLTHQEDPDQSVYDSLVRNRPLPIENVQKGLDLVPSSLELARAEMDMASMIAREGILKASLSKTASEYDYVIIDCPPSLGIITSNALVASQQLFIPLTAEALPLKGLTMLDDFVSEVRNRVNPELRIGAVFFTRYNNRNLNKEVVKRVEDRYGDIVMRTKIRENIALAETPLAGQSIFHYAPDSNGARDYMALAQEILNKYAQD